MLRTRVITALVLLAVLLPALFARPAWPFAAVTLVLIAAAGWEWGRLNGASGAVAWGLAIVLAAGGAAAAAAGIVDTVPLLLWAVIALAWIVGCVPALRGGTAGWSVLPPPLRWGIGLVVLGFGWAALAHARAVGLNFVLSVMALVWAADIGAYAGGRAFGRHKLARTISPGKTWEGAIAGAVAVLVVGLLWMLADARLPVDGASVYTRLQQALGWAGTGVALLALAAMSVVGDLIESLIKRAAGAKDSSGLLPGHGGVLDRIDALLPVFPCAVALHAWVAR